MTKRIHELKCRECGTTYPAKALYVCENCFGPLEVSYDYETIRENISREKIAAGPKSLWRYFDLLPVEKLPLCDTYSGFTPLVRSRNLAKKLGLNKLYIKNDTVNHPTLSFKDRVVSVALARALELGFTTTACASTGNLANSVAAHSAALGLETYIFIPESLERSKISGSMVYGPNLVPVKGHYDDVNRLCSEISANYDWAFVNINIRPYYAEGSKTIAFETIEQLDWTLPDQVVVPMASGSLLTKIRKGFQEFVKVGLIDGPVHTKINGAQAEGCSPISTAFQAGRDFITPVKPDTIAKSIAIGNPADGFYALNAISESGGSSEIVSNEEIIAGMKLLAETEGIFAETAGGVTIATLQKLVEQGKIDKDEVVVAYITGHGLKTLECLEGHLDAPRSIEPTLEEFEALKKEVFSSK